MNDQTRNIFDDDFCICPADMQLQQQFYKRVSPNTNEVYGCISTTYTVIVSMSVNINTEHTDLITRATHFIIQLLKY